MARVLDRGGTFRGTLAAACLSGAFSLAVFSWLPRRSADTRARPGRCRRDPSAVLASCSLSSCSSRWRATRSAVRANFARDARVASCTSRRVASPKLFAERSPWPHASRCLTGCGLAGAPVLTCALVVRTSARSRSARCGANFRRPRAPPLGPGRGAGCSSTRCRLRRRSARDSSRQLTAGLVQADLVPGPPGPSSSAPTSPCVILDTTSISRARPASVLARSSVWPETGSRDLGSPKSPDGPTSIGDGNSSRGRLPLVFGSYDVEGTQDFNSAIFLDRRGGRARSMPTANRLFPAHRMVPSLFESEAVAGFPWLGRGRRSRGARANRAPPPAGGRARRAAHLYDAVEPAIAIATPCGGPELILTIRTMLGSRAARPAPPSRRLRFRSIGRAPAARAPICISAIISRARGVHRPSCTRGRFWSRPSLPRACAHSHARLVRLVRPSALLIRLGLLAGRCSRGRSVNPKRPKVPLFSSDGFSDRG